MNGNRAGPVTQPERIASIDVLRGVAVLGILIMNIQAFAMPGAAYMNPSAYGNLEGPNYWVWYFSHLLADQKFWTIFSMLFGAGIVLMTSRAEAAGRPSAGIHYRRMAWLVLLGLLHEHLLWYGDILYSYAMCGFVAYLFRKFPPWLLISLGLLAIMLTAALNLLFGWGLASGQIPVQNMMESWAPSAEQIHREITAYRGGWLSQMSMRMPAAIFFETFLFFVFMGARSGGLILIGMALYKLGVFSAKRSARFYVALVALGAFVGIPLIVYGAHRNVAEGWDIKYSFFLGGQFNYWASILAALGWVGLVMLMCQSGVLAPLRRVLAAVGQMALTNYLMQSIICTTIFYGHGFGEFGRFERTAQLATVVAVWAVQLIWSPIWLRSFRFGPFEWLWRSLTYLKLQPMRR